MKPPLAGASRDVMAISKQIIYARPKNITKRPLKVPC